MTDLETERQFNHKIETENSLNFMLTEEIDEEIAADVLLWLGRMSSFCPEQKLSIYINCSGGELSAITSIAEGMSIAPNPIRTVVTGKCYSGAALIAAAGTKGDRHAYKYADFMIHQMEIVSQEGQESVPDLEEQMVYLKRANESWLSLMSQFTGMPLKTIKRDTQKEKFLTAQEALKYGLIDHIVEWQRK